MSDIVYLDTEVVKITWRETPSGRAVLITGEVDLSSIHDLREALNAERLVIDMTETTFIDSSGLRCLLEARQSSKQFVLWTSSQVDRLLELGGVTEYLTGRIKTVSV